MRKIPQQKKKNFMLKTEEKNKILQFGCSTESNALNEGESELLCLPVEYFVSFREMLFLCS
jgi:hypothetical protein